MKTLTVFITLFFLLLFNSISGQNKSIQAELDYKNAKKYYEYIQYDSAIIYYQIAAEHYRINSKDYFNCQVGIGQCFIKKNEFKKALIWFIDLHKKVDRIMGSESPISASCSYYQGYALLYLTEFEKALMPIENSLSLRKKLFGESHTDVAQSFNLLGQFYIKKGDYEKALGNFNNALKIREKIFGLENPEVANTLGNISIIYYYLGYLDTALILAEKGFEIRKKTLPKDHPDFILSYNLLAAYHNDLLHYDQALDLNKNNLLLCEKYYGKNHPVTATIYGNIGINYSKLKNYEQALVAIQLAVEIQKSLGMDNSTEIASNYISIGNVYDDMIQYENAVKMKEKAVKILTNTAGEYHPTTAMALNSLAISYQNSGDFNTAVQLFEKSLHIFNQIQGNNNPNSAMCLINLGSAYLNSGQSELSLNFFQQALTIYNSIYQPDSYEFGILYHNIGETYNSLGEYDTALEYFKMCLNIDSTYYGVQSEELAKAYKNLGNCNEFMGKTNEALQNYQKALEICLSTLDSKHLTTAVMYENISKLYSANKDYNSAWVNAEKALSIRLSRLPKKHYLLAYSFSDLAYISYKLGNYNASLQFYTQSLENNLKYFTFNGYNIDEIPKIINYQDALLLLNAFKGKTLVYLEIYLQDKGKGRPKGDYAKIVLDHLKACDQTIDIIRRSNLDEKDKLLLSSRSRELYDLAVNFCNLLYLELKDKKYIELCFYYSEKLKSISLFEALWGAQAKKFANLPDSVLLYEKQIDRSISNLKRQIASNPSKEYLNQLFFLEQQKQAFVNDCEVKYPTYFQLKYASQIPEVKDIQASLKKNEAIISYYQTQNIIYQIVLTHENISIAQSDTISGLTAKIEEFRHAIIFGSIQENADKYKKIAAELYETLFPLKIKKGIDKLILIPSPNLASIPFEALLTSKVSTKERFISLPYLINQFQISYAYSASLYYLTNVKPVQSDGRIGRLNDWLAFAPVFSDESTAGISVRSSGLLRQINAGLDTLKTRGTLLNGNYVSPLPGTENEVKTIFDAFDKNNKKAVIKINQSANESYIKSDSLAFFKNIHFATHGFVDSEKPELSGILLAQDTTGGNDGILFSGEIYNLDLNAELVALSACETGLGKIQAGEGIIGLTRALLYAGVKNIIVSLWQVSDESTAELMIGFYSEMLQFNNQTSFSAYLRNSKLKLIKSGKFSHPYFWSPFILIGK